jgi:hypothetical protein
MAGRTGIGRRTAAAVFVLGIAAMAPHTVDADAGKAVVMGIVEYVDGPNVTVAGKTYNLKGARFQDGQGVPVAGPADLRGKTIEILIRNRKIESVTVYPTLPQ